MANSKRRARCLLCGQLVPKEPSTILPYAVKPLTIDGKHGCICSICVDDHYAKHNSNVKALTGFSKRSTINEIIPLPVDTPFTPPMQSPTELLASALKKLAPIPVVVSHAQKPVEKAKPKDISYKVKYACLDYSLDSYFDIVTKKVFGQDEAAKMLIYTIYYNQMVNLIEFFTGEDLDRRNHILLIGGTGVGKTFLATTVAEVFKLPYALSNSTPITSAGYVGSKVENLLETLYRNAGCNLELAENGIIIIDEIDKKRANPDKSGRDVTGLAVQEELLKILEPSNVYLKEFDVTFNTKNITVILMGAFVGLDEIIAKRLNKKVIGFKSETENPSTTENISDDDLINYGFIPEFIGRLPAIIGMPSLSKEVIIDIIYSLLNKINIIFKFKNVDLIVNDFFIDALASEIVQSATGARDIYKRFFHIFYPALYRVFQSNGGGVCEYDEHGNTTLIVGDKNAKIQTYEFESLLKLSLEEE